MHVQHEEEQNGLTLKIVLDEDGASTEPGVVNDIGNGTCVFAVLHRRYHNPSAEQTVGKPFGHGTYDFTSTEGIAAFEKANAGKNAQWAVFPLFMYDHSGTAYRASQGGNPFSCPWDSGRVGIIALKKSEVGKPGKKYKNGDGTTGTIRSYFEQAQSLCEDYTSWANGEIYGFIIEDEDGEQLDSCWGFIGDPDGYILEEARSQLEYYAKEREHEELAANITHFAEIITEFAQVYQHCAAN